MYTEIRNSFESRLVFTRAVSYYNNLLPFRKTLFLINLSIYLRLDMRVGLIRKATKHPDADSLYVEEVSNEFIYKGLFLRL